MSDDQELIPIEQHTLTFYGKPIIVVRLPDGRPGVVLRFLCENLHIDTNAQVQRVQPGLRPLSITIIDYPYLCNRIRARQKEQFWQRSPMVMSL